MTRRILEQWSVSAMRQERRAQRTEVEEGQVAAVIVRNLGAVALDIDQRIVGLTREVRECGQQLPDYILGVIDAINRQAEVLERQEPVMNKFLGGCQNGDFQFVARRRVDFLDHA
jgi:hypothetical protein